MEELSLDECFTTNQELWCLGLSGICSTLVAMLGISYMCLELLVKLIKICDKVTGAHGCEVTLGMNGNIQVIAFVGKEGSDPSCSTRHIFVGELS